MFMLRRGMSLVGIRRILELEGEVGQLKRQLQRCNARAFLVGGNRIPEELIYCCRGSGVHTCCSGPLPPTSITEAELGFT